MKSITTKLKSIFEKSDEVDAIFAAEAKVLERCAELERRIHALHDAAPFIKARIAELMQRRNEAEIMAGRNGDAAEPAMLKTAIAFEEQRLLDNEAEHEALNKELADIQSGDLLQAQSGVTVAHVLGLQKELAEVRQHAATLREKIAGMEQDLAALPVAARDRLNEEREEVEAAFALGEIQESEYAKRIEALNARAASLAAEADATKARQIVLESAIAALRRRVLAHDESTMRLAAHHARARLFLLNDEGRRVKAEYEARAGELITALARVAGMDALLREAGSPLSLIPETWRHARFPVAERMFEADGLSLRHAQEAVRSAYVAQGVAF